MIPGEYHFADGEIELNKGSKPITIKVKNVGDRPCQVGSHLHYFETNSCLKFDREKAWGKRLDIPSGSSVRLEPGQEKEVQLIDFKGKREVYGFDERVEGPLDDPEIKKQRCHYNYDEGYAGSLQHKPELLPDYSTAALRVEISHNEHTTKRTVHRSTSVKKTMNK